MFFSTRPFHVLFTILFLSHVAHSTTHSHNRLESHRLHALRVNGDNNAPAPAPQHFNGSRFTWFHTGQNACGSFDQDNDPVVAISSLQWDNGVHCHKPIVLEYQGRTTQAWVTDKCAGCANGAVSMSRSLFASLVGDLHIGAVHLGSWAYDSASTSATKPDTSFGINPTLSPASIHDAAPVAGAALPLDETLTTVQPTPADTHAAIQSDDAEQVRLGMRFESSVRAP
ncbi:hypothetical protein C8Q78DRAFT_1082946 [Trametes maxima]|nr:hypothetical protein C8Q78DRAFT_1082946 [Trametes maxima]